MNGLTSDAPIPLPSTPSPGADHGGDKLPNSFEGIKQKRRGPKPGSIRGNYNKNRESREHGATTGKAGALPIPLFTPETVRPIVSLPFNLACVKTGFDGFLLREEETQILSASGATVLNTWVTIDPKLVALLTFSIAMLSITAEKSLLYHRWTREMEAERKRQDQKEAA